VTNAQSERTIAEWDRTHRLQALLSAQPVPAVSACLAWWERADKAFEWLMDQPRTPTSAAWMTALDIDLESYAGHPDHGGVGACYWQPSAYGLWTLSHRTPQEQAAQLAYLERLMTDLHRRLDAIEQRQTDQDTAIARAQSATPPGLGVR
jgi:hypothetical protein